MLTLAFAVLLLSGVLISEQASRTGIDFTEK